VGVRMEIIPESSSNNNKQTQHFIPETHVQSLPSLFATQTQTVTQGALANTQRRKAQWELGVWCDRSHRDTHTHSPDEIQGGRWSGGARECKLGSLWWV